MHHLLVTVRALPKEQRREAMEDVKAMVKSHVRVTTLRAVDLAHDIALMQEDLAG